MVNLLSSPLFAIIGIALMAVMAWMMLKLFPLLEVESRVHKNTLPLDGLRGLAASSVLFHHAFIWFYWGKTGTWSEPPSHLYAQMGPAAVTLFFFVSGYLFWDKAIRRPDRISYSLLLPNRMRRILPAYWAAVFVILISAAVSSQFQIHEQMAVLIKEGGEWILGGFPNLESPDINHVSNLLLTAGVFWTLRMEWMFYASLPLLHWFRKGWRLVLLFVTTAIISKLMSASHSNASHTQLWALIHQYFHMFTVAFAIGMIAAYRPWKERLRIWMISPGAALIAVAFLFVELSLGAPAYTLQRSILLAPLFFTVIAGNGFGGLLSSRPMRALGQISYSVYIFHGVVLFDVLSLWNRRYPIATMRPASYAIFIWMIGMAVVIISTLSYWYIERLSTQRIGSN